MRRTLLCVFLLLASFALAPPANGLVCGDVNGDSEVNLSDLVYLVEFMMLEGPPPVNMLDANVDFCAGSDVSDILYIGNNIFSGGPDPCTQTGICGTPIGGMIVVDHVDGLVAPRILATGVPVTFHMRYINNTSSHIHGATNGFKISSPEGATWTTSTIDSNTIAELASFPVIICTPSFSTPGSGVDTLKAMLLDFANPSDLLGMAPGFSGVPFTITIGPLLASDEGKSIVLDSMAFNYGGTWKWAVDGRNAYRPAWGGPYRYFIGYRPSSPVAISVSNIDGNVTDNVLPTNTNITFDIQYENLTTHNYQILSNGFKIYSLDGATWSESHVVNTGVFNYDNFDGGVFLSESSNDGVGADTLGFGAVALVSEHGMPAGFSGVPLQITMGPISSESLNKTICLDSSWYPPINNWVWGGISIPNVAPDWYGPYCFLIADSVQSAIEFAPLPDTLYFQCYEGGSNPAYEYMRVVAVGGESFAFTVSTTTPWVFPSKANGMTPDSVFVTTDAGGMSVGTYYGDLMLESSEAANSPKSIVIKLTVLPTPVTGIIMDRVMGGVGVNRIRTGVPVNFDLRVINNGSNNYRSITNAIRVYSPNGATWGHISGDTIGTIGHDRFDLISQIRYTSNDGVGSDSVLFAFITAFTLGIETGFDETSYRVTVGPIDPSYAGKSLCLDSCYFPPTFSTWLWDPGNGLPDIVPDWGGPYCYNIVDVPAYSASDSNFVISSLPDTLFFHCYEGGSNPSYDYFRVTDVYGGTYPFTVNPADGWVHTDKAGGISPDSIFVTADASGMTAGSYYSSLTVDAPDAANSPQVIAVKLDVLPIPTVGVVLDHVDDGVGPNQIRIGTQVNFDLRLINNESFAFSGVQNGFRFYSPDGATWNSTTADTIGEFGQDLFNLIVAMVYFSPDGINEDTVGFGAALINSPGLYSGYDGPSMRLTVGPIDASQVGKTLCFDSTFFPPAAIWLWHSQMHGDEVPEWGGPYCFNIVNAPDYPEEPPPPPTSGDSLIIPSITVVPGTGVQTVSVQLSQPIKGATVPLRIPDGVVVSDIERDSLITADWDYAYTQIKQDSGFVFVALANSFGATIPTGTTDLFRIHFSASNFSCEQDRTIRWDTTLMGQVSRQLTFSDTTVHPVYPGFSYLRDSVSVLPFTPGDCSADNALDISDLVCLAEYMFIGGAEPVNINAVDNNGDCLGPDISDLIYLVDYQFLDGPAPLCGCVLSGKRNMPQAEDKVLAVTYEKDATIITLTSPVAVRGVEFTLKGAGDVIPVKLVGDKLDLLSGNTEGGLHVGILDMDGPNTIPSGNTRLVRLIGTYEIASAIVAVDGSRSEAALLSGNAPSLPDKFELYQNYPNPFNPSTEIGFALPQTANVRLEIFNIMGQRVKQLADRQMEAGVHTILWDGRDAAGNAVASGVYFYRIDAGQYTASRKMLLLK
jgi:hypothetical protein